MQLGEIVGVTHTKLMYTLSKRGSAPAEFLVGSSCRISMKSVQRCSKYCAQGSSPLSEPDLRLGEVSVEATQLPSQANIVVHGQEGAKVEEIVTGKTS